MANYPQEQQDWLKKKVAKGIHPADFIDEFNEKFNIKRTYEGLRKWLQTHNIHFGHLQRKSEKEKRLPPKQQIEKDIEKGQIQQKIKELNTKYRILVKEKGLEDRLIQVIKDETKALPEIKREWQPSVEKVSQETAILLLSDTHIGEVVMKEEVYDFGEYNFNIFAKRMKLMANSINSITTTKLKGYRIDKLVIYMLGDMVSGRIHEELLEKGEEIIFQIMQGSYVTAQFILELSQLFSKIEVVGVVGNHGRLTYKPRYKRKWVSWDYVFYQFLSGFLATNNRIKCTFPKSFFTLHKIYDWSFLLLHGDNIKSWMMIPWYGINRMVYRLGDLLQSKGERIDYRLLGHFHQTGELSEGRGEIILNGSVIGGTEYSLGRMFAFSRPTQLFLGCHADWGTTWRYPLRLDTPELDDIVPYSYNSELTAGELIKQFLDKREND